MDKKQSDQRGPVGVGIVGAGFISSEYLETLMRVPDLRVLFIADQDGERAETQARQFGVERFGELDEMLAIPSIEIVVNLTTPAAHAEIGHRVLAAGKHLWTEKPLTADRDSARALLDEADKRRLRVGCAPDTILGSGLQTAIRLVAAGRIGTPLNALAMMQIPGPELWHPNPEFIFDRGSGPLFEIGPYFLTPLVHVFGPVVRVTAASSRARLTRNIGAGPRAGTEFPVNVPTQYSALLLFAGGGHAVLIVSFDSQTERSLLEINGTSGSLALPNPMEFDRRSLLQVRGGADQVIEASTPGPIAKRGIGVLEMARSIRANLPETTPGRLAYHVLDVLTSISESAASGASVDIASTIFPPAPLGENWDPFLATL